MKRYIDEIQQYLDIIDRISKAERLNKEEREILENKVHLSAKESTLSIVRIAAALEWAIYTHIIKLGKN